MVLTLRAPQTTWDSMWYCCTQDLKLQIKRIAASSCGAFIEKDCTTQQRPCYPAPVPDPPFCACGQRCRFWIWNGTDAKSGPDLWSAFVHAKVPG